MKAIFLKVPDTLDNTIHKVFSSLGITNYAMGDSANSLGGIYSDFNIFGLTIKVEENSYDYEDDYNYSIFVKKSLLPTIDTTEENVDIISKVIVDLLRRNLQVEVAVEEDNELKIYPFPSSPSM